MATNDRAPFYLLFLHRGCLYIVHRGPAYALIPEGKREVDPSESSTEGEERGGKGGASLSVRARIAKQVLDRRRSGKRQN